MRLAQRRINLEGFNRMLEQELVRRKRPAITAAAIFLIVILALLAQRDILGYEFTGTDTVTLIDSSRIESSSDVRRIFTNPTMYTTPTGVTQFWQVPDRSVFYRPVSALSYAIDYRLWGLDPFGYHVTDLVLHIFTAVLLFLLVRRLTGGRQFAAWLSAVIFSLHPLLLENLSSSSRRQDILPALFMLLALFFFLKRRDDISRFSTIAYLCLSLGAYVLALGSQEISFVFPFIILAYLIIYGEDVRTIRQRLGGAFKGSLPYFILMLAALAWHVFILPGLGGYVDKPRGLLLIIKSIPGGIFHYFFNLTYPGGVAGWIISPFPGLAARIASVSTLLITALLLLYLRRQLAGLIAGVQGAVLKAVIIMLLAVAMVSMVLITAYPLLASSINRVLEQAYQGTAYHFIGNSMGASDTLPVEFYFYKARNQLIGLLAFSFFVSLAGLAVLSRPARTAEYFRRRNLNRPVLFLLVWILLPLGVYLPTMTLAPRELYLTLIPFCALLALAVVAIFPVMLANLRPGPNLVVLVALLLSFLPISPLFRSYGEWQASSDFTGMFFNQITEVARGIPAGDTINLLDLPQDIYVFEEEFGHPQEVSYPVDYTVKSWLELNYPGNGMTVTMGDRLLLPAAPEFLNVEAGASAGNRVDVAVSYVLDRCTDN